MFNPIRNNKSFLAALFIVVLGSGFFATLIASALSKNGVSSTMIGLMTTFFYAGLVLGAFRIEHLIARVSHIRAYAAFASALAVVALLHGIFLNTYFWLFLRFIGGFVTAGVFVVIESWLLCQSSPRTRGQMLALYMITFYAAQAIGQLFLKLYDHNLLLLVVIISMCCSLSVIPVAMTQAESPQFTEPSTLGIKHIFKKCISGVLGCFAAGLLMGVIYGLLPVYYMQVYKDPSIVANLMFTVIMGGMLLQYPVGRLSDVFERRLILLLASLLSIVISAVLLLDVKSYTLIYLLSALFGGLIFTIYPVSISYACDSLENKDIVAGTQTLLLFYSAGAMLGPIIAPQFMRVLGSNGLFAFFIVTLAALSLLLSWRRTVKEPNPQEEAFIAYPAMTPISSEVDPRGES